jgi:hypothetical protein
MFRISFQLIESGGIFFRIIFQLSELDLTP